MAPMRLLDYSRTQPSRSILFLISIVTFLAGLWLLTPWYVPTNRPAVMATFNWSFVISGLINSLICAPALYGVWKNTPEALARGAFYLFIWFMFVTATRVVLTTLGTVAWVPTFIIALVIAVVYVEQKAVARGVRDE